MFIRHRRLIWSLALLELRLRYAGSRIALAWVFLAPVVVLAAYVVLFGWILRVRPIPELSGMDYGLLVACGLLPWIGVSEGVTRGTGSVLAQRNLLKSRVFPMELIPVTAVCTGLVGQLCGTGLLLAVLGLRGSLSANLMLLPLLLGLQVMLTIGAVWFLSCVNVLYRDTSQVVGLLMVLLMFVSPIAYTQSMVPAGLEWVVRLNPLSYLIAGYRAALLSSPVPNMWGLVCLGALALLVLLSGHHYFMRLRRLLPDFV